MSHRISDKVWVRGALASEFSIRGVIEDVDHVAESMGSAREVRRYGVRLENGNFLWCEADQLKEHGA